jgi:hypothetical protein
MLSNTDAVASIAVKNIDAVRDVLRSTLGLTQVGAEGRN